MIDARTLRRIACSAFILCTLVMAGVHVWRDDEQTRVVWVIFKESVARSSAAPAVSDYTLDQRRKRGIGIFPNDAPIPAYLIAKVTATGARIREQSRWLRAVSVEVDARGLRTLRAMDEVAGIRPVGRLLKASAPTAAGPPTSHEIDAPARAPSARAHAAEDSAYYGINWPGIRQLGIPPAHQIGFVGAGIRVAIFDTGFERDHDALRSRSVFAQRDFINHDAIVADQPGDTAGVEQEVHGTEVWSVLGAFQPGVIVGPAYGALFLLAKVDQEPGDTKLDEDRWIAAVEWADSLGARIINSSVSFRYNYFDRTDLPYDSLNGDSFLVTRQADEAARRGILVVQAIGDAPDNGPRTLSAPADADSVMSVGSVDRFGNPAVFNPFFTAKGPTADGRTKPEVVALGTGMRGADSRTRVGYNSPLSGTSYSTALISGAAAMFMQAWPDLPPMAVRRAFQLSGSTSTHPNDTTGWGVPDVGAAILFPDGINLSTLNPVDLNGAVTSVAPTFSWTTPLTNASLHPIVYRVQVATDTGFTSIVFTDTVREAQSLTATSALPPSARLYWRVVATSPIGITRASPRAQFRVPDWVKLLTLAGDQTTFSPTTQPQLAWVPLEARAAGPFTYDVQILANGTGEIVQTLRNLTTSTVRVPAPLAANQSFRWRVIVHARTGQVDTVQSLQPFVVATDDRPPATILYQNFPNPFPTFELGSVTRIWFDLAADGPVSLTVNTLRGIVVKNLIPARGCPAITMGAGIYGRPGQVLANEQCTLLQWDGTDDRGARVAPGVYVLKLQAAGRLLTKKILFTPSR